MDQLIAHLVGDYVLQNHWMATRKTKAWWPAVVHVLLYGLPFLLLVDNALQWSVIVGTHLVIDRFRLAALWVRFWGNGTHGTVMRCLDKTMHAWLDPNFSTEVDDAPPFLGVWLLILVDNVAHLTINYAALRWLTAVV